MSIITLGIGGVSDLDSFITTGLQANAVVVVITPRVLHLKPRTNTLTLKPRSNTLHLKPRTNTLTLPEE